VKPAQIDDTVTFTLRLPESQNEEVKKTARQMRISQNDLIKILVNWGLSSLQKINQLQLQELSRVLSRTL